MQLTRTDDGFTLVESLLAIVILGIISIPLSGLLIAYLHNVDATQARLLENHDAQLAANYFAQDVASIGTRDSADPPALLQSVETAVAYNAGLYPCGAVGTPTAVVRFAWDDFTTAISGAQQVRVAYVVKTVGTETQLHRITCVGSATPATDRVVAHELASGAPPTVTCSTSCAGAGSSVPRTVTLTMTMKAPQNTSGNYVTVLTGTRRQS